MHPIAVVPYFSHTILADNGIGFASGKGASHIYSFPLIAFAQRLKWGRRLKQRVICGQRTIPVEDEGFDQTQARTFAEGTFEAGKR